MPQTTRRREQAHPAHAYQFYDGAAAVARPSGSRSGKWHAAWWPCSVNGRSGGSCSAQISCARGQRVRNRQPDGGLMAEGSSPLTPLSSPAMRDAKRA
jgi:hypothetical protein